MVKSGYSIDHKTSLVDQMTSPLDTSKISVRQIFLVICLKIRFRGAWPSSVRKAICDVIFILSFLLSKTLMTSSIVTSSKVKPKLSYLVTKVIVTSFGRNGSPGVIFSKGPNHKN